MAQRHSAGQQEAETKGKGDIGGDDAQSTNGLRGREEERQRREEEEEDGGEGGRHDGRPEDGEGGGERLDEVVDWR